MAASGIQVFLLVGNHDLPNAVGRATAVEIFDTLTVHNVTVASQPDIYSIKTRGGIIQIAALPWWRRNALLSREETRHLSIEDIKERLEANLNEIIQSHIARLDLGLPAIMAAHISLSHASPGERIAFNFHPSKARRFLTIRVNVSHNDPDPTAIILRSIARQERDIKDAIVRVQINIAEHLDGLVQEQEIHRALGEAQYVSIAKDVERERRTRLGDRSAEAMSPTEALKVYLALKKTPC